VGVGVVTRRFPYSSNKAVEARDAEAAGVKSEEVEDEDDEEEEEEVDEELEEEVEDNKRTVGSMSTCLRLAKVR
jgi:hypothetical protein